jgi:3'(2'), 5'-bisphosphate nucleotidase
MPYEGELAAALQAYERARQRILEEYAGFQAIADAHAEIKLRIDRETQDTLVQHLDAAFPTDSFCAEEDTFVLARVQRTQRDPDRVWVIDPIDGTRGFARKTGEFSVMVALLERGVPVLGVVAEPAKGRLTYAVRGAGCWRRDGEAGGADRRRVTATGRLAEATLAQSHSGTGKVSPLVQALGAGRIVRTYSGGIKLALVARGEADLYLNTYADFRDWDVCAGHVLVEEAGGRVTDRFGAPVTYGKPGWAQREGLLATNGVLHDQALAALRGVG